MGELTEIEQVVRTRLRSLRQTLGLSLDDLAARTNLSPSTISRVETGKRTISLDILLPLATALQVDLESLLDVHNDDDVVIRPVPSGSGDRTTWMLSRPTGTTVALKMRIEPYDGPVEQRVHPGHDWFFVTEGRVRLWLGDREIIVETGEAAEFATMTPHACTAVAGPKCAHSRSTHATFLSRDTSTSCGPFPLPPRDAMIVFPFASRVALWVLR